MPAAGGDANQFVGELFDAMAELRTFAVGVRLDGGVGVNTVAVFPREPKVAATLGRLSQEGGAASVASLPVPAAQQRINEALTCLRPRRNSQSCERRSNPSATRVTSISVWTISPKQTTTSRSRNAGENYVVTFKATRPMPIAI